MNNNKKLTLAHVTHEAVEHIGGIGTVLEGMMTSPVYQQHVKRSILVGPYWGQLGVDPSKRLGEHGQVLYSSMDQIDTAGLGVRFRPIEWAFNVAIIYGKRTYHPPGQGRTGESEVLLIDVFKANADRLNVFKHRLWERFGLDSARYDSAWDYEEYVRLAEPALYALRSLLKDDDLPCTLFSHEFMGMPAALAAILDGGDDFRTVFHAHECATARHLVENHPGHDTMFYNVLDRAQAQGLFVDDVFPGQDRHLRHALVSRSHLCDGIIAVGDRTADELRFLNRELHDKPIDLVYNGLPAAKVPMKDKLAARAMLQQYAKTLCGDTLGTPDVLMTHIARPVLSKGIWRDLAVCHAMEPMLQKQERAGVLFILTSGGGVRRRQDVLEMEQRYGWPRHHHEGFPDLVGPEVDLWRMIEPFNREHKNVQVVLVNQFGWSPSRIGKRLPEGMDMHQLRIAVDVEFGMATYEPFGISPLEPLNAGALCVISNVCGCEGFVRHVTNGFKVPNVLSADYVTLGHDADIERCKQIGTHDRDALEAREATRIAGELMKHLPTTDTQRETLIANGQKLVARMGWDQVLEESMLPMLRRIQ